MLFKAGTIAIIDYGQAAATIRQEPLAVSLRIRLPPALQPHIQYGVKAKLYKQINVSRSYLGVKYVALESRGLLT